MATYYIRTSGNNSNAGTSAGAAWLTFGKALGATGISSGDQVWVGAGTYRETVSVAMTSAVVETKIYGDVDGAQTGDAGEVRWTAYTTNDTTAPSATTLLNLNGKDFLTFQDIVFIGGTTTLITATTATSTDITFRRCAFVGANTGITTPLSYTTGANTAANWVIDSCTFIRSGGATCLNIVLTRPASADFDYNIIIKNCLFTGGGNSSTILLSSTGANVFNGGGVIIMNCSQISTSIFAQANDANLSTSVPALKVYNCFIYAGQNSLNANTAGQIVEDYNVILGGSSPRTNVTAGTHSISNGSYAPLFYTGHEYYSVGSNLKPFGMPKVGSPMLSFGNQASSPTVDILGAARPSATLASVGCYELGQGAVKETTTIRTGSNAWKIAGYGYQDYLDIPVNATLTTITIYARYNSSYVGTLPSMNIVNGGECGVADATATQVGAADTWEQLSLTFTPTSSGIVTVRLKSLTTAAAGSAFFDDFDIT